jgi:hypothetical protein
MKIEEERTRMRIIKHVIQFNRPLVDGFQIMTGLLWALLLGIIQIAAVVFVVVGIIHYVWTYNP